MPCDRSSVAIIARRIRSRRSRTAASSVSPSTPQFQLRLSRMAVAVVLAVRLVVLVVVGDDVRQREAVMRGDEVDARPGPAAAPVEEFGRAEQPASETRQRRRVALPVGAHRVAVLVVPFRPDRGKVAELIAVRPGVPGLGDQLDAAQDRILADRVEKHRVGVELVAVAAERACEVEAEAVDMAFLDPVAQRIHHHLQHARLARLHRVAAAGGVEIVARIVGQDVVAGVVDAAEDSVGPIWLPSAVWL